MSTSHLIPDKRGLIDPSHLAPRFSTQTSLRQLSVHDLLPFPNTTRPHLPPSCVTHTPPPAVSSPHCFFTSSSFQCSPYFLLLPFSTVVAATLPLSLCSLTPILEHVEQYKPFSTICHRTLYHNIFRRPHICTLALAFSLHHLHCHPHSTSSFLHHIVTHTHTTLTPHLHSTTPHTTKYTA